LKVIKWGAIAALIEAAFAGHLPNVGLPAQIVISGAALVVLTQAAIIRGYVWMTLFLVVTCLFNPIFSIPLSRYISGLAITFAALSFFFSVELLKPKSRLSVVSTSDRPPGGRVAMRLSSDWAFDDRRNPHTDKEAT